MAMKIKDVNNDQKQICIAFTTLLLNPGLIIDSITPETINDGEVG